MTHIHKPIPKVVYFLALVRQRQMPTLDLGTEETSNYQ
jgi:hypothetical protein